MAKIKPYTGTEPYIFVSYAHKNSRDVMPIIERLVADGYRVWYDEGIDPGTEWTKTIAKHIEKCSCMIAMMSDDYVASENCKDEIELARELKLPRLIIYLRSTALPIEMRMTMNRLQAVHKYTYTDIEEFFNKLYDAEIIKCCKGASYIAGAPKPQPKTEPKPTQKPAPRPQPKPTSLPRDAVNDGDVIYDGNKVIGCDKSAKRVVIKEGTAVIDERAFSKCSLLESVIIPEGIKTIENAAFDGCGHLQSVNLPSTLSKIGSAAFRSCKSLSGIDIPNKVSSIGEYAFKHCTSLSLLVIPEGSVKFYSYAFSNCTALKQVVIKNGLGEINLGMFADCVNLCKVEIPASVKRICSDAFKRCHKLSSINYNGTVSEWNSIKKEYYWITEAPNYIIHCTDGDIKK